MQGDKQGGYSSSLSRQNMIVLQTEMREVEMVRHGRYRVYLRVKPTKFADRLDVGLCKKYQGFEPIDHMHSEDSELGKT